MPNTYLNNTINLGKKQISAFVPTIITSAQGIAVLPVTVKGTIKKISGAITTDAVTGPVTYTTRLVHNGVSTEVTNSTITIPVLGGQDTVSVSVFQPVVPGDTLVIEVGGTNTNAGTGAVSYLIT